MMGDNKENKENLNNVDMETEKSPDFSAPVDEFAVYKPEDESELTQKEKELSESMLKESTEKVLERKTSKSKIINICFFAISIIILICTLVYQRNEYGVADIGDSLFNEVKYRYIFIILGVFLSIMLFDSLRTHILLYKATRLHRPILSYKSTAICRYYDCITPFAFGGQPFQIFYLNSRGVRAGIASSVPLAKYMFSQISFCFIALIMLILGASNYGEQSKLVITLSIISLVLCFVFLFAIVFISVSKKLAPRLIMWLIKLASKLKLVKDYKLAFTRTMRTMFEYQKSIIYYLKSIWVTLLTLLSSVMIVLFKALIPYLIYLFLTPNPDVDFFVIFSKFIICELATMYIPLPGGSGMAEISFNTLFAALFLGKNGGNLFWALLIYRIASYYIYILQGFIIIVYDLLIGDKRNRKFKEGKLIEMQIKANNRLRKHL